MKPFTTITTGILTIMAIVHLLRLVNGWPVTVGGFFVPLWWSGLAFVILAALALMLWREAPVTDVARGGAFRA